MKTLMNTDSLLVCLSCWWRLGVRSVNDEYKSFTEMSDNLTNMFDTKLVFKHKYACAVCNTQRWKAARASDDGLYNAIKFPDKATLAKYRLLFA